MSVKILEETKEKLKLELKGETVTTTQIIADFALREGVDSAAIREHPFMEEPKILVVGSNPRKALEKAVDTIQEKCAEMKAELEKQL